MANLPEALRAYVVLVDEQDRAIGIEEKLRAHLHGGKLHRAFSVFLFDPEGRLLLQRRAEGKYHFAGRWSNTCCSHPGPDENVTAAAHRRLREEMGIDAVLQHLFRFTYSAFDRESGLTERELDHVFGGEFSGVPRPAPEEVSAWRWSTADEIRAELAARPASFSPWFREVFERVIAFRAAD